MKIEIIQDIQPFKNNQDAASINLQKGTFKVQLTHLYPAHSLLGLHHPHCFRRLSFRDELRGPEISRPEENALYQDCFI